MAILFPVFTRVRENARRSSCQNRLKQLALGTQQYMQDNDERLFGAYTGPAASQIRWMERLKPYIKENTLYFCPSENVLTNQLTVSTTNTSYCYNFYYLSDQNQDETNAASPDTARGRLLSQIQYPDATVLFSERTGADASLTRYTCRAGSSAPPTDPHLDGVNAAFIDGHVKWYSVPGVLTQNQALWDRS